MIPGFDLANDCDRLCKLTGQTGKQADELLGKQSADCFRKDRHDTQGRFAFTHDGDVGAGNDAFGDCSVESCCRGESGVINEMGFSVGKRQVTVGPALHEPVLVVYRAATVALIAFYATGAVFISELDDGRVQVEFLQQEGQEIIHDDLQVEGPIDDLGGLQPDEK